MPDAIQNLQKRIVTEWLLTSGDAKIYHLDSSKTAFDMVEWF